MKFRKFCSRRSRRRSRLGGNARTAVADTGPQEFTVVKIGTNTGTVVARGVITAAEREENNRLQAPRGAPFQVHFSFPRGDLSRRSPLSARPTWTSIPPPVLPV